MVCVTTHPVGGLCVATAQGCILSLKDKYSDTQNLNLDCLSPCLAREYWQDLMYSEQRTRSKRSSMGVTQRVNPDINTLVTYNKSAGVVSFIGFIAVNQCAGRYKARRKRLGLTAFRGTCYPHQTSSLWLIEARKRSKWVAQLYVSTPDVMGGVWNGVRITMLLQTDDICSQHKGIAFLYIQYRMTWHTNSHSLTRMRRNYDSEWTHNSRVLGDIS